MLASYWHYRGVDMEQALDAAYGSAPADVFADSGGFSAWRLGGSVVISGYVAWLKRWESLFSAYANLDVIGDAQATWNNQRRLEDVGLSPLPVFHVGTPFDWLDRYAQAGYEYVALGGMVPYLSSPKRILPWLIKCFRDYPQMRFHGFGATVWDALAVLPFASTDSTTWTAGSRYGAQLIFAHGKLFQTRAHLLGEYLEDLHALGFSVTQAVAATRGDSVLSQAIALASLKRAEDVCRRRHRNDYRLYLAALLPEAPRLSEAA